MIRVVCTDRRKCVTFTRNGGQQDDIRVNAMMLVGDYWEYWFSVGSGKRYKTLEGAKKSAVKEMASLGYHFDEKTINEAKFNDQEGGQQ